ncbi:MAG: sulfite exporter TauE/SafE family protein [Chitinophagaceae bacterium]
MQLKYWLMLYFLALILIGFLIGSIGTLIGAGGGFLLVPLLLIFFPALDPEVVTAISIAVVAANAISGTFAYARGKRIDYRAGLMFALFTIPGSILGVYITNYIPKHWFQVIFGALLLVLSVYLFLKNRRKNAAQTALPEHAAGGNWKHSSITDKSGHTYSYTYNQLHGIIISVLVGFISPLLGIGGGIIHVPAMVQWLQFPVYIATATSHFILAIMSSVSVGVHIVNGHYNDPEVLRMVIGFIIGVLPGAQLGAYLSHRISTTAIIRSLAVCLALVGVRILFAAIAAL